MGMGEVERSEPVARPRRRKPVVPEFEAPDVRDELPAETVEVPRSVTAAVDVSAGEPVAGSTDGEGAEVAVPEVPEGPVPLLAGTFAGYPDGEGGIHFVAQMQDGTVHRKHMTAALMKTMAMFSSGTGGLAGKFKGLFGGA